MSKASQRTYFPIDAAVMMRVPARCLVVDAAEADMKLARFLQRRLREPLPPPLLHKWIRSGQVRVNGCRSKPFARLAVGDIVRLPPFALPSSVPNAGAERPPSYAFSTFSASNTDAERPHSPAFSASAASNASAGPALGPGLDILAVSGDLLVLSKSAGLSCHPGSAPGRSAGKTPAGDSVSARLSAAFAAHHYIPAPVHRLDRRTSGLLLAGLSHARARRLHELFRQGGIARYYLAWSWGRVPWDGTRILNDRTEKRLVAGRERVFALPAGNPEDFPPCASLPTVAGTAGETLPALLPTSAHAAVDATAERPPEQAFSGCSRHRPDVYMAALFPHGREGLEKGRALCAARVIQRLEADSLPSGLRSSFSARGCEPAATLLLLRPLTGHKHQLRAQLAARGFPLIGDPLYGGPPFEKLLLHACALRLPPEELAAEGESGLFFLDPPWEAPFAPATPDLFREINGESAR